MARPRRRHQVQTQIGYALSGLAGVGITAIGARFLLAPRTAAAGYGLLADDYANPYLAVKGVRDIASGLATFLIMSAPRAQSRRCQPRPR